MTNNDAGAIDATMTVLAHPTRRWLLNQLQATGQLSMDRVVELADDNEPHVEDPSPAVEREAIEASLRHVHLPKMVDAGTVEWNPDTGEIVANGNTKIAYNLLAI